MKKAKAKPVCVVCERHPAMEDADGGGRCENCWAKAAWWGRWFTSGLERNCFPHQARRGRAARRSSD